MPENEVDSESIALITHATLVAGVEDRSSCEIETPETQRLTSLLQIARALSGVYRLKPGIHHALSILARDHGAFRSSVTLLREGTNELHIESSIGLSGHGQRVRYHIGEGVTGRVVETCKP